MGGIAKIYHAVFGHGLRKQICVTSSFLDSLRSWAIIKIKINKKKLDDDSTYFSLILRTKTIFRKLVKCWKLHVTLWKIEHCDIYFLFHKLTGHTKTNCMQSFENISIWEVFARNCPYNHATTKLAISSSEMAQISCQKHKIGCLFLSSTT